MTSSLESQLAAELRHEAERVGDLSGLAERVVARAHVVRRRRGLTAAAVSGVAVVVLLVAFVGGGIPHTSTLPPANKTPHPSEPVYLAESLRQLPQGGPPDVDYVVGTQAHLGGRTHMLPSGWIVSRLLRAGDRWVVTALNGDADPQEVVATLTKEGDVAVLDRGVAGGLAVDPSGRYVAWGSESSGAPSKHQLTEYDLTTGAVVAHRTVAQPASVVGWATEGVIASYLVDPGGSPVVWDPQAGTLTKVWGGSGGGPTFVAYSGAHHLWLLDDWLKGCDVVLSRVGGTAPGKHCTDRLMRDGLNDPVAFFAEDQLLAVASASTHSVRIFDAQLADTGDRHPIPAGTVALQIVPTTGVHLLLNVLDISSRSSHVLGCVGNGPCERLLDGSPGEELVLASP
jgi:hypothetical protein